MYAQNEHTFIMYNPEAKSATIYANTWENSVHPSVNLEESRKRDAAHKKKREEKYKNYKPPSEEEWLKDIDDYHTTYYKIH